MEIVSTSTTLTNVESRFRLLFYRILSQLTADVSCKRIIWEKGHNFVGRQTRLNWPPIGTLPPSHWNLWREFLERLCGTSLRLPQPLGGWYQEGEMLTQLCVYIHDRRLIMFRDKEWYEYRPVTPMSRTRFLDDPIPFADIHLLQEANVADIKYTDGVIYVVTKSAQIIIPKAPDQEVHTLQDLYTQLPLSKQRIMGHIQWPDEDATRRLAEAIRQGKAVGVSDGSVRTKADMASHAWILQAPDGSEISGFGPVDGTSQA